MMIVEVTRSCSHRSPGNQEAFAYLHVLTCDGVPKQVQLGMQLQQTHPGLQMRLPVMGLQTQVMAMRMEAGGVTQGTAPGVEVVTTTGKSTQPGA